jgi:hypothetical protein
MRPVRPRLTFLLGIGAIVLMFAPAVAESLAPDVPPFKAAPWIPRKPHMPSGLRPGPVFPSVSQTRGQEGICFFIDADQLEAPETPEIRRPSRAVLVAARTSTAFAARPTSFAPRPEHSCDRPDQP